MCYDEATILKALQEPLGRPERGLLRLGLVLNGTVSAGAWTAGALDALIEALDAWEAEKNADPPDPAVPRHRVRLEIIGGASGGAVCAAIFARAIGFEFPPGPERGNPFWDVWVEGLDIGGMLRTDGDEEFDAPDDPVFPGASLLSDHAVRAAAKALLDWADGKSPRSRNWVAPGLRVLMTQTNLRGVSYTLPLRPSGGASRTPTAYRAHADHVCFALQPSGPGGLRGDEFPLRENHEADWQRLARHARASGAFPGGFPPVRLERPGSHYHWRAVMLPGKPLPGGSGRRAAPTARLLQPAWGPAPPEVYRYDAVDGGALNNSPFALVHERMAGLGGALCRDELDPDGAIIVIDPLAAAPRDVGPDPLDPERSIARVAGLLIPALVANGRFGASELMLATDDAVASRHLFTGGRKRRDGTEVWGEDALAGSGLGAFLGFLDRKIREHDFLLGRSNMRAWLRKHFVLDAGSTLFGSDPPYPTGRDAPVIPLCGSAACVLGQPAWPRGLHPEALRGSLGERLSAAAGRQFSRWLFRFAAGQAAKRLGTPAVMQALERAVQELDARA